MQQLGVAFLVGGALAAAAQLVLDWSNLTPGHVMVLAVSAGALAAGLGWYEPLARWAQAGASVPLTGFGYALVTGVVRDYSRFGWRGFLSGGLAATAMGITVAVVAGFLAALVARPRA